MFDNILEAIFDSLKDVPLELQGLQQTWAHAYALYGIHSSNLPAKMQNKPSHWVAEPCMIQRRKLKWKWEKRRENEEEETLKLESHASATTWEGSHDIASSKPTWISSSISIDTLLFLFTFFLLLLPPTLFSFFLGFVFKLWSSNFSPATQPYTYSYVAGYI